MQNEVARTLNDLQSYSSTREAKVEAGRILQEQRKLETDAAKLQDLLGKDSKDLTDAQKAQLDELRDNQKRLEERTQQLLSRMRRTAEGPKELEKLAADQEELRQEIQEARGPKELEPLEKTEKELAERTKTAAEEMKRLGAEKTAAALKKAADAMERDAERLKTGQKPESDDAQKGLQDALNQKDPAGARELKEALEKALQAGPDKDEAGLQGDMKKAGEELAKNQLNDAKQGPGPGGEQASGDARTVPGAGRGASRGRPGSARQEAGRETKGVGEAGRGSGRIAEEDQGC